ncbi:MAG TPA: LuxR C-terminal-related transcriptional regulator [Solirubrobacteraceae bacterium]|jgi:DNA-binding CsgD family transcriptional regulator
MRATAPSDTELLLDLVGEAYSFEDLGQYRAGVLDLLMSMVPYDSAGYNEISPGETFIVGLPQLDEGLHASFTRLVYENPLIERFQRTGDGRPYRISDVIDQRGFRELELYKQFYRHIGVERQVAFTLPSQPSLIVGIALCREHVDFTEREVAMLTLARPHLIQAYRNAELRGARAAMLAALEQGLDTLDRHVIVVDTQGRVEFATDSARRLLGVDPALNGGLPAEVSLWLSDVHRPRIASEPLVIEVPQGTALVRLLPGLREDRRQVLLIEGGEGELSVAALRGFGLTARESEALRLLALGNSADQTSRRMGIARRTLDKHLQRVYAKLGVKSVGEATATAWAAVGVRRGGG